MFICPVHSLLYCSNFRQLPEGVKPQLFSLVQYVFGYDISAAEKLLEQLMMCVRQRHLVFFYLSLNFNDFKNFGRIKRHYQTDAWVINVE